MFWYMLGLATICIYKYICKKQDDLKRGGGAFYREYFGVLFDAKKKLSSTKTYNPLSPTHTILKWVSQPPRQYILKSIYL